MNVDFFHVGVSVGDLLNMLLNGAGLVVFFLVYLMLRPIHGLLSDLTVTLTEVVKEMRLERERQKPIE